MANNKNIVSEFVQASGADAIPRMSRMLNIDRSITDINIKDSTYSDFTALHQQARFGTTGSVAWLLRQDPPAGVNERDSGQFTPLMYAVMLASEDPEGKVRLLLAPIEILRTVSVVLLWTGLDRSITTLQ